MNNERKIEVEDSKCPNFYINSGGSAPFHNKEIIKKIDTLDNTSADFDKDGLIDRAFVLKLTKNNSYSGKMAEDVIIYIVKVLLSNGNTLMTKEINLETRVIGLGYDKVSNQIEIKLKTDEFGTLEGRFIKEFSISFK
jgi:hypothetical protein